MTLSLKKLLIGLIISGVFIYVSLRGVDFNALLKGLEEANYSFVAPSILLLILLTALRSLRWGVILSPLKKVDQKTLFPITCIGYMAIVLIPMRIGEVVRPLLLSNKNKEVPLMSGLGTVVVERVLDALVLAAVLLAVIAVLPLPGWAVTSGIVVLGISLIIVAFMVLVMSKTNIKILPARLNTKLKGWLRSLADGFKITADPRRFSYILLLTVLTWITSAAVIYFLFPAYKLELPPVAALAVLSLTGLGIMLPAAPGFVGNIDYACILALSFFGVPKQDALVFAVIYHVLSIGITVILGLVFLPFESISLQKIKSIQNILH